jgi:hypothetical protein
VKWLAILLLPALALAGEAPVPVAPAPAPSTAAPAAATPTGRTATAAPVPPPPAWATRLRADAKAVLKGEDFHRVEESRSLVMREWLRRWLQDDEKKKPDQPMDYSFLATLAQVLKWLVIVLLTVALGWLLWRGWQWLAPQVGQQRAATGNYTAQEAQSLALSREALPEGVSSAARAAWQRGDHVLALSLLYRGAVRTLEDRYAIRLPDSATEGECLRLARRSGKAVVGEGFAPIVRAWMALAYASQAPDDFDALAALYARHFETRTAGGMQA